MTKSERRSRHNSTVRALRSLPGGYDQRRKDVLETLHLVLNGIRRGQIDPDAILVVYKRLLVGEERGEHGSECRCSRYVLQSRLSAEQELYMLERAKQIVME